MKRYCDIEHHLTNKQLMGVCIHPLAAAETALTRGKHNNAADASASFVTVEWRVSICPDPGVML